MDEKYYNTGIFYKYATVNFDQLTKNLADDPALARKAVSAFCKAFVSALPTGSQNAMAAHQHPFVVFITLGKGSNSNLSNAFANIDQKKDNPLKITTQALIEEFNSEQAFFEDLKAVEKALLACQKPAFLQEMDLSKINQVNSLSELWQQIESALEVIL